MTSVLHLLLSHMEKEIEDTEWVICRLRAEAGTVEKSGTFSIRWVFSLSMHHQLRGCRVVGYTLARGTDDPGSLTVAPIRMTSPSFTIGSSIA